MTKKRGIPERWEKYLPMGCRVPGTRFLPFKVPLKPELCRSQPEDERFTPTVLLENTPMMKAIIDLTNTNRYYNSEEFTTKGVAYKKINVFGGGRVPSKKICEEFFDAVDQLCRTLDHDSDALIGVHCTHGLNRTGYLICKYMVLRMKIDPQEAITKFQEARGYEIERKNYVSDIISPVINVISPNERSSYGHSSSLNRYEENWRAEPRPSFRNSANSRKFERSVRNEPRTSSHRSPEKLRESRRNEAHASTSRQDRPRSNSRQNKPRSSSREYSAPRDSRRNFSVMELSEYDEESYRPGRYDRRRRK